MIKTKNDLIEYIKKDNAWMIPNTRKERLCAKILEYPHCKIKKYLYYLRKQEYYINTADGKKWKGTLGLFYERKKNKLGQNLGIEIGPNCFGKGLNLFHYGSIIINPKARIGRNCSLHGNNCIGNNGKTDDVPTIGNNVDIGYGAVIIGNVTIGDNVTVGANAVVNSSFEEGNCTIAGIPAKIIKK